MISGGFCGRCGSKLKLLFSSWYCDCANEGRTFGYALLIKQHYEEFPDSKMVPIGTSVYLFKELSVGKEFADAFLGFVLLRVELTSETILTYSSKDGIYAHDVSSELPCEVVQ